MQLHAVVSRLACPAALQRCAAAAGFGFQPHGRGVVFDSQALGKRAGDGRTPTAKREASALALGRRAVQGNERVSADGNPRSCPRPVRRWRGSKPLSAGAVRVCSSKPPRSKFCCTRKAGRCGDTQPVRCVGSTLQAASGAGQASSAPVGSGASPASQPRFPPACISGPSHFRAGCAWRARGPGCSACSKRPRQASVGLAPRGKPNTEHQFPP